MTEFENKALAASPIKPLCWFRKADDTFVALNKTDKPQSLLDHLNTQNNRIQFTMEQGCNKTIPFWILGHNSAIKQSPVTLTSQSPHFWKDSKTREIDIMFLQTLFLSLAFVATCSAHNYGTVLSKSILFYEAQRSGDLPSNNRVSWRRDSATNDKGDNNRDLSGGWYDAGDYVKFNFPMAWAVTVLAWGILDFKSAYQASGQYQNALKQIKWPLDYFLKCHPNANTYYVQVGNGDVDHGYFGRPEDMNMWRPAYKITTNKPGSDIAAETAAAMAAGYLVFKDSNRGYANTLKTHAIQLFNFAKNYQRKYSDHGSEFRFYTSSGYKDELVWAAAWLYRATRDNTYLRYAENNINQLGNGPAWAFSWDDKKAGAQVLLHQLTGRYKSAVEGFLRSWRPGSMTYTPQGIAWRNQWGPNRYVANTAALALLAHKNNIRISMGNRNNRDWACHQIDLLLGDSGRSYVVGYGNRYPKKPHHRSSACPVNRSQACNVNTFNDEGRNNPSILNGALVGGPGSDGSYEDRRGDYIKSEVAVDYNAGFQTAVAGCKQLKG
ncbi:endoglucanase E-4-like [Liolophura sinensis]|uniref:endoglucanase E-4-like n=1 Tax=Liolophura sinensis TaxID=3198878 RepID=UPI00315903AB